MRRKRQQLDANVCESILKQGTSGVLALCGADGYPYAVPLNYVYADGYIYFHCAPVGHKMDALNHCAKASFCVIDKDCILPERYTSAYRSVICFGEIHPLQDKETLVRALRLLGQKYAPKETEQHLEREIDGALGRVCVLAMQVERMTGKQARELMQIAECCHKSQSAPKAVDMSRVKAVVFDFGGVLIDWNPRYFFRSYFHDDERMEYFLAHVCNQEWNEKQDGGRSIAEAVAEAKRLHPEFSDAIDCYYGHFPECLGGAIEKGVTRLRLYKELGYRVYGLTNWAAETFHYALERFDFLQLFDGIVVSGKEHVRKPDPRIFQILLTRYGLQAEECLFLDDHEENLIPAQQLGMQVELVG